MGECGEGKAAEAAETGAPLKIRAQQPSVNPCSCREGRSGKLYPVLGKAAQHHLKLNLQITHNEGKEEERLMLEGSALSPSALD